MIAFSLEPWGFTRFTWRKFQLKHLDFNKTNSAVFYRYYYFNNVVERRWRVSPNAQRRIFVSAGYSRFHNFFLHTFLCPSRPLSASRSPGSCAMMLHPRPTANIMGRAMDDPRATNQIVPPWSGTSRLSLVDIGSPSACEWITIRSVVKYACSIIYLIFSPSQRDIHPTFILH